MNKIIESRSNRLRRQLLTNKLRRRLKKKQVLTKNDKLEVVGKEKPVDEQNDRKQEQPIEKTVANEQAPKKAEEKNKSLQRMISSKP